MTGLCFLTGFHKCGHRKLKHAASCEVKLRREPHDFPALCCETLSTGQDERRSQRTPTLSGHFACFYQPKWPVSINRYSASVRCVSKWSYLAFDQNSALTATDWHEDVCLLMNIKWMVMIANKYPGNQ